MDNSVATRFSNLPGSQSPSPGQRIYTIIKALALTTVLSCLLVAYYILIR